MVKGTIEAINLESSPKYFDKNRLQGTHLAGARTFKTYTFNDKFITLKTTTSVTCTVEYESKSECTGEGINLTGLIYANPTEHYTTVKTWLERQGVKPAEVVMSYDQKQLSIMICAVDLPTIKPLTEYSFIAGTRDE